MERDQIIHSSIIADMSEGVMVIRFNGVIELANAAALEILEKSSAELVGKTFASAFFGQEENDAFTQSVLDAVYEKGQRQESYVSYRTGQRLKQLRVVSSCLHEQGVPRLELALHKQEQVRRAEGLRKGGRFHHGKPLGHRHQHAGRHGHVLRVSAAAQQRAHFVAHVPFALGLRLLTQCANHACGLQSEPVRPAGRRRVLACPLQKIRPVQRGG